MARVSDDEMKRARFWGGVQGASALVFSGYLATHLVNTAVASLGPESYDGYMRVVRRVYQHPAVEPVVFGSFLVHLAAGTMKPAISAAAAATPRRRLHAYTGYFLSVFVFLHSFATRVSLPPPLSFNGIATTMYHLPSLFIPYYLLLGAAGAVHMLLGFPKAVEQSRALLGPALSSARAVGRVASHWLVVTAAVVAVGLGVASMGRLVYPYEVDRSEAFRTFFEEQYREIGLSCGLWRN
ncbi:hypothetical protein DIPPA_20622 [Diplonema papillatum]|nr:hypothetical protein DIPPA_20622 [Diplonema papillatum]